MQLPVDNVISNLNNDYTAYITDSKYASILNLMFLGSAKGIASSMVVLGVANNPGDLNKPISTATKLTLSPMASQVGPQ